MHQTARHYGFLAEHQPSQSILAPQTHRDIGLDGIKVVATFLVIFIHVSGVGFAAINHPHWLAVDFYQSVSRICVPLFFMVTGALLLPTTPTIKSIVRRVWRVGLPLAAWSYIYLLWHFKIETKPVDWAAPLYGPVVAHLWYLYALIGIYLSLPVLSGFFRLNETRVQIFSLAFWFFGSSVLMMIYMLTKTGIAGIDFSSLVLYGGYVAAGALLYWRFEYTAKAARIAAIIAAVSTVGTCLLTRYISMRNGVAVEIFFEYSSPLVLIATLSSFIASRPAFNHLASTHRRFGATVVNLSHVSFGIYLVHPMIIWTLGMRGFDFRSHNYWWSIPLVTIIVFMISALVVGLMQRIPLARKIVS